MIASSAEVAAEQQRQQQRAEEETPPNDASSSSDAVTSFHGRGRRNENRAAETIVISAPVSPLSLPTVLDDVRHFNFKFNSVPVRFPLPSRFRLCRFVA